MDKLIRIKRSESAGAVPPTLAVGELAINLADLALFVGTQTGVKNLSTSPVRSVVDLQDPQFGFKFDGSDETAKLQQVADWYAGRMITTGNKEVSVKSVKWPSGTYLYSTKLKTLAGAEDFVSPIFVDGRTALKKNIFFMNVEVDGNRQNQAAVDSPIEDGGRHGFRVLGNIQDLYLFRCKANYCAGDGYEFFSVDSETSDAAYKMRNITMVSCVSNWNRRHGFSVDSVTGFTVIDGVSDNNGTDLNTTQPLNHGSRGARYNNNLYGRGFDFEDYGIGTAFRNVVIDGFKASGNVAGLLFHSSANVNMTGFIPRGDISLSNIEVGVLSPASTNASLSFYNESATKAKPAFTNIEMSNCRLQGHLYLAGVRGCTFRGRLRRTGGDQYSTILGMSAQIRIDAEGDDGRHVLYDNGAIPPVAITTTAGLGSPTMGASTVSVMETFPAMIIKVEGTFSGGTAGLFGFSIQTSADTFLQGRAAQAYMRDTGLPVSAAVQEAGASSATVLVSPGGAGTYSYSVVFKVGAIYP